MLSFIVCDCSFVSPSGNLKFAARHYFILYLPSTTTLPRTVTFLSNSLQAAPAVTIEPKMAPSKTTLASPIIQTISDGIAPAGDGNEDPFAAFWGGEMSWQLKPPSLRHQDVFRRWHFKDERLLNNLGISNTCKLVLDHFHLITDDIDAWPKELGLQSWATGRNDLTLLVKSYEESTYFQVLDRVRHGVAHALRSLPMWRRQSMRRGIYSLITGLMLPMQSTSTT